MTSPSNMLWDLLLAQPHDEERIMRCLYDHPDCCSLVINDKLAIHVAIEQGLSMDIIKQMLICYPACCSRKDSDGYLLLHDLLQSRSSHIPSDVVQFISDANVEAARSVDVDGNLPIHMECNNHCRYDVITKLLNIYPDSINIKDIHGNYPLHCAISNLHDSFEVISYLIDLYPAVARIQSKGNDLPLHIECYTCCRNDVIMKLLDIYPDSISITDGWNRYPLQCALTSSHSSNDVISYLINAYPDAVHIQDSDGDLPLHTECYYSCRYDIIIKLLNIYPDAIHTKSANGPLPLLGAINSDHGTYAVISYLIDAYPDAVRIKDNDDCVPLHTECCYSCRYDIIVKLLDIYPAAIRIRSASCRFPLLYAIDSDNGTYEVISYLVNAYPDALRMPDDDGSLPLHIECASKCRCDVIKLLYDVYPDAVGTRGSGSFMPIYHVFLTYYKSYVGEDPNVSSYSAKQSMQYKALVTTMIETCCSAHVTNSIYYTIIDCFYINQHGDDLMRYRLFLNLASRHLESRSLYVIDYHDRNYQSRVHLLHHIYQLSSNPMNPPSNKGSDMYDVSLFAVLLSMLDVAGRLHGTHDIMHDDMKFSWMKCGDDIGCVLLRKVVLYL